MAGSTNALNTTISSIRAAQTAATVVAIIDDILIVIDDALPLFRFPLRGQTGAGGFPPRRKNGGSPHKRDFKPLH